MDRKRPEEENSVAPCGASTDNKDAIPAFTTPAIWPPQYWGRKHRDLLGGFTLASMCERKLVSKWRENLKSSRGAFIVSYTMPCPCSDCILAWAETLLSYPSTCVCHIRLLSNIVIYSKSRKNLVLWLLFLSILSTASTPYLICTVPFYTEQHTHRL